MAELGVDVSASLENLCLLQQLMWHSGFLPLQMLALLCSQGKGFPSRLLGFSSRVFPAG